MPSKRAELWWLEMRSEIPQIEVITAIGEADLEDYVAQLLFTQGWSIIFRAFDGAALEEFMTARSTQLRTIIVYTTELPAFTSDLILKLSSTVITFVSLDGVPSTAHEIMQKIRSQLRLPMVHQGDAALPKNVSSPIILSAPKKVIVITGSAGAPGKTMFATSLAQVMSSQRKVTVIDADFRSPPLESYITTNSYSISSLSSSQKPVNLPEGDAKEVSIIDVGVLPPLNEVVNDRRWTALLYNSILDSATQLVYISQTTKQSLTQLDIFLKELPVLTKQIPITYICICVGQSKQLRKAQAAFTQIVGRERHFFLNEAHIKPSSTHFLDSLWASREKGQKEIGSIATSLLQ